MNRPSVDESFPQPDQSEPDPRPGRRRGEVIVVGGTSLAPRHPDLPEQRSRGPGVRPHPAPRPGPLRLRRPDLRASPDGLHGTARPHDGRPPHAGGDRAAAGGARRDTPRPSSAPPSSSTSAVAAATCAQLSEEGRAVTKRLAAGSGRLGKSDLEWLNRATHEVPRHAEELAELHRSRIARLLESSQQLIRVIFALYVAFLVVGGCSRRGRRRRATQASPRRCGGWRTPPRGSPRAASRPASGSRSANEIGLLSHTFNVMAERLQEHERELRRSAGRARGEGAGDPGALPHRHGDLAPPAARPGPPVRGGQGAGAAARRRRGLVPVRSRGRRPRGAGDERPPRGVPGGKRAAAVARPRRAAESGDSGSPLVHPGVRARAARRPPPAGGRLDRARSTSARARSGSSPRTRPSCSPAWPRRRAIAIERARLSEEVRSLAAVEERERLAREMHDGLAQALGLLHLKLQGALARSTDAPAVAEALREMVEHRQSAYEDVRQSIFGLRTFVSRGLGLVPTLTEYLHEFSAHSGIAVELEASGAPARPDPSRDGGPGRAHHPGGAHQRAQARRGPIAPGSASSGTAPGSAWRSKTTASGWDPRDSRRIRSTSASRPCASAPRALGGRLEIETAPGRGTRIVATLPGGGA